MPETGVVGVSVCTAWASWVEPHCTQLGVVLFPPILLLVFFFFFVQIFKFELVWRGIVISDK